MTATRIDIADGVSPPEDTMNRCLAELHAVPFPKVTGELGLQVHLAIES